MFICKLHVNLGSKLKLITIFLAEDVINPFYTKKMENTKIKIGDKLSLLGVLQVNWNVGNQKRT